MSRRHSGPFRLSPAATPRLPTAGLRAPHREGVPGASSLPFRSGSPEGLGGDARRLGGRGAGGTPGWTQEVGSTSGRRDGHLEREPSALRGAGRGPVSSAVPTRPAAESSRRPHGQLPPSGGLPRGGRPRPVSLGPGPCTPRPRSPRTRAPPSAAAPRGRGGGSGPPCPPRKQAAPSPRCAQRGRLSGAGGAAAPNTAALSHLAPARPPARPRRGRGHLPARGRDVGAPPAGASPAPGPPRGPSVLRPLPRRSGTPGLSLPGPWPFCRAHALVFPPRTSPVQPAAQSSLPAPSLSFPLFPRPPPADVCVLGGQRPGRPFPLRPGLAPGPSGPSQPFFHPGRVPRPRAATPDTAPGGTAAAARGAEPVGPERHLLAPTGGRGHARTPSRCVPCRGGARASARGRRAALGRLRALPSPPKPEPRAAGAIAGREEAAPPSPPGLGCGPGAPRGRLFPALLLRVPAGPLRAPPCALLPSGALPRPCPTSPHSLCLALVPSTIFIFTWKES